jgi:hypothetical protein
MLTSSSSGPQTLRGFLRMASPLLRKRRSAFGPAEHGRYPDAMRQGNGGRVLQSLSRHFAPDNNSLERTAQISAKLRLTSIFSGAQLAPR